MAGVKGKGRPKEDPIKRFWKKVDKGPSCWVWIAARYKDGYGQFWFRGRMTRAHIASYQMHVGEIPDGLWVLHKCDNPWCVRPDHLFLGTPSDNMKDMHRKNRHAVYSGEENPASKLTKQKVDEAREQHVLGVSQRQLAKRMGVSPATMSLAINGKTWCSKPN